MSLASRSFAATIFEAAATEYLEACHKKEGAVACFELFALLQFVAQNILVRTTVGVGLVVALIDGFLSVQAFQ